MGREQQVTLHNGRTLPVGCLISEERGIGTATAALYFAADIIGDDTYSHLAAALNANDTDAWDTADWALNEALARLNALLPEGYHLDWHENNLLLERTEWWALTADDYDRFDDYLDGELLDPHDDIDYHAD